MAQSPREKDFKKRLDEAKLFKDDIKADLVEGYFFTAPRRAREIKYGTGPKANKSVTAQDQAELHTTIGIECGDDFAAMLVDAFMPPNFDWARRGRGMLDSESWAEIKEDAQKGDLVIMEAIKASQLYGVIKTAFYPDMALGTAALWIEDGTSLASPPDVRAIPIRALDICPGPNGTVGARFVTEHVYNRDIPAVLKGIELPPEVTQKIQAKPNDTSPVVWGLIPNYDTPGTEAWDYCIHVNGREVHHEPLTGEGSCPLIVGRFNVDPSNPWADGPTLMSLPYLRALDALTQLVQDNAEFQVDPSFIFPSDGIMNFEGGLQSGMAYPAHMGFDKGQIAWLRPDSRPDQGLITAEMLREGIRRLHYADFPEQKGKTPPTASQWIDEMVKMQKRLGLAGQTFWYEMPRAIFMRFKFLMEKRGLIKKLTVQGQAVSLEPYNPAVKGQEYQEVQMAQQLLSLNLSFGGVEGNVAVDVQATMRNIQEKLGDKLVVWRDPKQAMELMQQFIPQADLNIGNTGVG